MVSQFSVAMSVYKNDNPIFFKEAIRSIYTIQSIRPTEIILVIDGPIPDDIKNAISEIKLEIPVLKVVSFKTNKGHAAARQCGLENSSNELVAIMDSDDIALPDRFEKQLKFMDQHPDVTVLGGQIKEFIGAVSNVVGIRAVPMIDRNIKKYLKSRCPMNLQTVMYRKSKVLEVGGFVDWYCEEDYYLWVRLALADHKFNNLNDVLVNVRVGKELYRRRGGRKYFNSEAKLQKFMYDNHVINFPQYVYNVIIRYVVQVMMPNSIRGWFFLKFARS